MKSNRPPIINQEVTLETIFLYLKDRADSSRMAPHIVKWFADAARVVDEARRRG